MIVKAIQLKSGENMKPIAYSAFMLVAVFISSGAYAQTFKAQAGLLHLSIENDNNLELTLTGLAGQIYLEPVDTSAGPWYEASFLDHASGGLGIVGKTDATIGAADGDGDFVALSFNHVYPDSLYSVGISYSSLSVDLDSVSTTFDSTEMGITLGKYFEPSLGAALSYITKTESNTGSPDTDKNEYKLQFKQVKNLQGSQAVNIQAELKSVHFDDGTTSGSNTEIGVSGDYYIDRKTGIGAGFSNNSGDDTGKEGSTYKVKASVFFTPTIMAELSYSSFSVKDTALGADSTETSISIIGRF